MIAPNYTDKHEVNTLTLNQIRNMVTSEPYDQITVLAIAAISLWGARDSARATAALQDAAIHKGLPRLHVLEKVLKAAWNLEHVVPRGDFMEMGEALFEVRELEAKS